jgi:hypothetical protein
MPLLEPNFPTMRSRLVIVAVIAFVSGGAHLIVGHHSRLYGWYAIGLAVILFLFAMLLPKPKPGGSVEPDRYNLFQH